LRQKNSISGTNPPLDYASFNLNENKKFLTLKIFSEELLVGLEVFTKKIETTKILEVLIPSQLPLLPGLKPNPCMTSPDCSRLSRFFKTSPEFSVEKLHLKYVETKVETTLSNKKSC
jgi:hypothetical protein